MDSIKNSSGFARLVTAAGQPESVAPPHKDRPVLPPDRISSIISFKGTFEKRFIRFVRELQGDLTYHTKDRSIPKMPREQQLEFICLLLAHKAESRLNDSAITLSDFYSLLTLLKESEKATPEIKNAIVLFRQYDPETFLTEGVELYNRRTGCQIKLEVKEEFYFLDRSYEATFNEKLKTDLVEVKDLLSRGMSSRQIFFQYPECRKDRFVLDDLKGRNYLKNTFGIDSPETLILIKKDMASIKLVAGALEDTKQQFRFLLSLTPYSVSPAKDNLESKALIKYKFDRMLSMDQVVSLSMDQRLFLEMPAIQESIDNFKLTMKQALALPNPGNFNYGLYQYINSGDLTPVEAALLTPDEKSQLNDVSLQMDVASGKKTVKEALGIDVAVPFQKLDTDAFLYWKGGGWQCSEQWPPLATQPE